MKKLEGKVAVITGGGSGVGLAAARAFLAEGARVAIAGRTAEKLLAAEKHLGGGPNLISFAADVGDPAQADALIRHVTQKWGRVDILVNNAGANLKQRTVRELTPETWRSMVSANLDSAFHCMWAVLPQMRERRDGVIICINSISGKRSGPLGGASYNAAKFGLAALGICAAAEEKDNNIRICNIFPGEIDTPILENRPVPVTDEQKAKILKPEDVAAAIVFVASLPPRVSVPELIIKPTSAMYV